MCPTLPPPHSRKWFPRSRLRIASGSTAIGRSVAKDTRGGAVAGFFRTKRRHTRRLTSCICPKDGSYLPRVPGMARTKVRYNEGDPSLQHQRHPTRSRPRRRPDVEHSRSEESLARVDMTASFATRACAALTPLTIARQIVPKLPQQVRRCLQTATGREPREPREHPSESAPRANRAAKTDPLVHHNRAAEAPLRGRIQHPTTVILRTLAYPSRLEGSGYRCNDSSALRPLCRASRVIGSQEQRLGTGAATPDFERLRLCKRRLSKEYVRCCTGQ
jgi:hypothetical protein